MLWTTERSTSFNFRLILPINCCSFFASQPLSYTLRFKTAQKNSMGRACGTFGGLSTFGTNGILFSSSQSVVLSGRIFGCTLTLSMNNIGILQNTMNRRLWNTKFARKSSCWLADLIFCTCQQFFCCGDTQFWFVTRFFLVFLFLPSRQSFKTRKIVAREIGLSSNTFKISFEFSRPNRFETDFRKSSLYAIETSNLCTFSVWQMR